MTKFDRLSDEDLYVAVEQCLANTIQSIEAWRHPADPESKGQHLALAETNLETALSALRPLMHRHKLRTGQ